MATLYANSSGNWTDAIWYDAATGQPYTNTYPQIGDTVYLNGKTITINVTYNIGNGTIRNDANADYGIVAGGYISIPTSIGDSGGTLTANYYGNDIVNFSCSTTNAFTFNGHIKVVSGKFIRNTSTINKEFIITGNVDCSESSAAFYSFRGYILTIGGNLYLPHGNYLFVASSSSSSSLTLRVAGKTYFQDDTLGILNMTPASSASATITLAGGIDLANNTALTFSTKGSTSVTIGGELEVSNNFNWSSTIYTFNLTKVVAHNCVVYFNLLNINGSIEYESVNNSMGVKYNALNVLNPDTFTWKDITEPRSNPFIIVTDAEMNNRQQYPPEDVVKQGVEYVWGEKVGTYLPDYPPESVVLQGYEYDNGDMVGSLSQSAQVGCVTKEDVREGVPLLGMGEVGTCAVPSPDDVREGVPVDDTIGTLIVQGGGDRLRIADFGYYTNAQSDTYIVDLTEQDKPKFAVAEERVLIEMFPELDLENIPEKYFDDLFVKYLKYRLIVEYYRTAGINSTFTPSEPTTEIVNYRNVNCEIWMNIANIYLKAWGEKYPNSIKKQRILL